MSDTDTASMRDCCRVEEVAVDELEEEMATVSAEASLLPMLVLFSWMGAVEWRGLVCSVWSKDNNVVLTLGVSKSLPSSSLCMLCRRLLSPLFLSLLVVTPAAAGSGV